MPEVKWKGKALKVTKMGAFKITLGALSVAFAINITNTTNQISETVEVIHRGEVEVVPAELDSSLLVFFQSFRERMETPDTTTVIRDSVVVRHRDSLVVTVRDSLVFVPVFETTIRDSIIRRTVWDTLRTKPIPPEGLGSVAWRGEDSVNCRMVVIPGQPVPFARPRPHFSKPGVYIHPKRYSKWLGSAKWWLQQTIKSPPLSGPLACEIVAIFPRPKSWPKKDDFTLRWRDGYPDIDNLMKAGMDAGNGILYDDDRRVVRLSGSKLYGVRGECGLAMHVASVSGSIIGSAEQAKFVSVPWGLSYIPCDCWRQVKFRVHDE